MKLPTTLSTCDRHGGVNCQSGADSDGSVICYDGFRGAVTRFRFSCGSPKISVVDVTPLALNGTWSVFLRNESSVSAERPTVKLRLNDGQHLNLDGPTKIDPLATAEFVAGSNPAITKSPNREQIEVSCANCSS